METNISGAMAMGTSPLSRMEVNRSSVPSPTGCFSHPYSAAISTPPAGSSQISQGFSPRHRVVRLTHR